MTVDKHLTTLTLKTWELDFLNQLIDFLEYDRDIIKGADTYGILIDIARKDFSTLREDNNLILQIDED